MHFVSIAVVITTIQPPTVGVIAIAEGVRELGNPVVIIGDMKSPDTWDCPGVNYLSYPDQLETKFALSSVLHANSYTRKMLGYLTAVTGGASWIRETDDDNSPYESFFSEVPTEVQGRLPVRDSGFINIYNYFTDRSVWPRGLPLNRVRNDSGVTTVPAQVSGLLVFQAVANGDPDVDAVYRLTAPDTSDIRFDDAEPLIIPSGTWTPFNSQATTWPIALLPLMYLPATCSFRMTDIWRSYVAQRLMQGLDARLVITSATVFQDRNEHDLMRDFRDEIEGYVGYERFVSVLEQTGVSGGFDALLGDLRRVYEALIDAEFFTSDELPLLDAWIADMKTFGFGPTA